MENRKFKLYSGKVVELTTVLNGKDIDNLYKFVGSEMNAARMSIYNSVAHLVGIDNQPVLPLSNATAFSGVLNRFDEIELSQLIDCYARMANPEEIAPAEELKNE